MWNRRENREFIHDRRLLRLVLYNAMISLKNHCRLSGPLKGRPTGGPEYRLGLLSLWKPKLTPIFAGGGDSRTTSCQAQSTNPAEVQSSSASSLPAQQAAARINGSPNPYWHIKR